VQGGLTVAVFGSVEAMDIPVLRRMQHHATSALAIALDVDAWVTPGAAAGGATPVLAQQGWRAAPLRPRDRLDTVWQELGRSGPQSSRVGGLTFPGQAVPR
jgi:hypothetical protein